MRLVGFMFSAMCAMTCYEWAERDDHDGGAGRALYHETLYAKHEGLDRASFTTSILMLISCKHLLLSSMHLLDVYHLVDFGPISA